MKNFVHLSALLFLAICGHAWAESGAVPAIDRDLPQPLDLGFADTLMTQSPFSRSVNLEDTLQLTGLAYIDGRPVATVLNKATKQNVLVSDEPNEQGWKLVDAAAGVDLSVTEVHMMVGQEVITMHYKNSQIEPKASVQGNSGNRLASGGSGNKGDKVRVSSLLGENGHDLYVSLSPDGRAKFKDLVKNFAEKKPDATPEQSAAYAQKVFSKIKAADQAPAGGDKPQKVAKPNKKKVGN